MQDLLEMQITEAPTPSFRLMEPRAHDKGMSTSASFSGDVNESYIFNPRGLADTYYTGHKYLTVYPLK